MEISHVVQTLARSNVKTILLLAFEDEEIKTLLAHHLPTFTFHSISKSDLAGKSFRSMVALLRSIPCDAAIASLYQAAVVRDRDALLALLLVTRTRVRFLREEKETWTGTTRVGYLVSMVPKILLLFVLGSVSILCTGLFSFLLHRTKRRTHRLGVRSAASRGNILFFRTDLAGELKGGGSVSHIKGMLKAFLSSGFDVVFVSDSIVKDFLPEITQIEIPPIRALRMFDEIQLLVYNLQLILKAPALIRQFQPCLIYQRHSIFNFTGGVIAAHWKIPFVLEANASEVWVKKNWSRLILHRLATNCESLAFHLAGHIAVISEGVREQLSSYKIEQDRFIINPNGVDPTEFHPGIDGAAIRHRYQLSDNTVVGFIGTFTRWHGIETLFDAAAIVVQRKPDITFLLIGDGDLRSHLAARAVQLNITDRVIFTGLVPHSDASHYLAACDILVSPHLGFSDGTKFFGSPTKLFEYMALGKPIIASKLEQIGEIIQDDINGVHMQPGNAHQLAGLIEQLSSNQDLRRRLGSRAVNDVVTHYTWKSNVERILDAVQ
ncbi:MAG: glycosyltransferase family 4 protein [bacterium]